MNNINNYTMDSLSNFFIKLHRHISLTLYLLLKTETIPKHATRFYF